METALANKMKEIENEFPNFQTAKDWALKNGAQEIFDRKPTSLGTVFQFPDKSEVSFDPAFGKDHIIVVIEPTQLV